MLGFGRSRRVSVRFFVVVVVVRGAKGVHNGVAVETGVGAGNRFVVVKEEEEEEEFGVEKQEVASFLSAKLAAETGEEEGALVMVLVLVLFVLESGPVFVVVEV